MLIKSASEIFFSKKKAVSLRITCHNHHGSSFYCAKLTYHLSFYISSSANQTETPFQSETIKKYQENDTSGFFFPKRHAKIQDSEEAR